MLELSLVAIALIMGMATILNTLRRKSLTVILPNGVRVNVPANVKRLRLTKSATRKPY